MDSRFPRKVSPSALAASINAVLVRLDHVIVIIERLQITLANPATEPESYTIETWCKRRKLSESQYHRLKRAGKGPRTMAVGSTGIRISREADAEWVAARETEMAEINTAIETPPACVQERRTTR